MAFETPPVIPPEHRTALRSIVPRLDALPHPWAITGSLGQALQGVPLTPHDIDLQSTQEGVFEIERRLNAYVTEQVQEKTGPLLQSYFGRMVVEGVQVEVMGDIQKAQPDGGWDKPPALETVITWVELDELHLPVVSLAYEVGAYRKMGRPERAALLERWLEEHRGA